MVSQLKLSSLIIIVFIILCFNNCKNSAQTNKHLSVPSVDTNKKKNIKNDSSSDRDTIFKDENIFVLGNKSDCGEDAISYVAVKFKQYIRFSDFLTKITNNQITAPINYSSNPLSKEFKTAITKAYKLGVNFGGHYTFAEWGCGSPCQMSVLVDVKTGVVYDGVSGSYGYDYKKNSLMLIVNPPGSDGFYLNCAGCEPLIYIWDEKNKKFEPRQ